MRKYIFILIFLLWYITAVFSLPEAVITISFTGDIMAHDVNFSIKDYSVVYEGIKDVLLNDDLTISNLEAPVMENLPYKSYPRFNMHREYAQAAIEAGVDVFSLANNHSLDQEIEGIYQTLGSLMILRDKSDMNIYFSGLRGTKSKEFKPVKIKKKGWNIGFLSVTQFLNGYIRNPFIHVVDYRNKNEADDFIKYIENIQNKYDLFILSYHAGDEYLLYPEQEKINFFRRLIASGVHIVYGHHPHVLQPYEFIEVKGKRRIIMYSMGNFISGQRWSLQPYPIEHYRSYTGDSIILNIDVSHTKEGPNIDNVKPLLITNHINEKNEVIIKKYEEIVRMKLDPVWSEYYLNRYEIMKKMLSSYGSLK